ncbi:hypothetical protein DINM_006586 [Dirofilaria immitis]|nr:hypothetical protein [Dirofilaria immitis]
MSSNETHTFLKHNKQQASIYCGYAVFTSGESGPLGLDGKDSKDSKPGNGILIVRMSTGVVGKPGFKNKRPPESSGEIIEKEQLRGPQEPSGSLGQLGELDTPNVAQSEVVIIVHIYEQHLDTNKALNTDKDAKL